MCRFFQWIDEPEAFDLQILLFSYDRNESSPLRFSALGFFPVGAFSTAGSSSAGFLAAGFFSALGANSASYGSLGAGMSLFG
jgi:hypothetical protein